jgi:hypothetical protein
MRFAEKAVVMATNEARAMDLEQSIEQGLEWLRHGTARQSRPSQPPLLALWDLLEEWFSSENFHSGSAPTAAMEALVDTNQGRATKAALTIHRLAVRQFLEDLAMASGASDPVEVASQVQILIDGAIVGALVDKHPRAAAHGREFTAIVLATDSDEGRRPDSSLA